MGREEIDVQKMPVWDFGQIFLQGDARYDLLDLDAVYDFFISNALKMEKEEIQEFKILSNELEEINGPQKMQKAIAAKLLEKEGWTIQGYEIDIGWGIVDVLAKNGNNEEIAVECGPCRLSKAINYFRMNNIKELWLIEIYSDEEILYRIKRDRKWEEKLKVFDKVNMEQLRKIKSPLDNI